MENDPKIWKTWRHNIVVGVWKAVLPVDAQLKVDANSLNALKKRRQIDGFGRGARDRGNRGNRDASEKDNPSMGKS